MSAGPPYGPPPDEPSPAQDTPPPDPRNPYGVPTSGPVPPGPTPYASMSYPSMPYQSMAVPVGNEKALWSMILGIGAVFGAFASFLCCIPFGLMAGIPAVILGPMARREIRQSQGWQTGAGQATAGLVCGIIGIVISLLMLAAMALYAVAVPDNLYG